MSEADDVEPVFVKEEPEEIIFSVTTEIEAEPEEVIIDFCCHKLVNKFQIGPYWK